MLLKKEQSIFQTTKLKYVFVLIILLHKNVIQSSSTSPPPTTKGTGTVSTSTHLNESDGRSIVIGVDGGTESIRACCFDAKNGKVIGKSFAVPYKTTHPEPGWAEQNPNDWYDNLGAAVRGALDSISSSSSSSSSEVRSRVKAICIDTTCCSVVALDEYGDCLRPSLLWMDARSAKQSQEILEKCKDDPALRVNSGGEGPLSAEWLLPKSLWIRQKEPSIWEKAKYICEYQDYINFKLTGNMCASSCNAAVRWHWDGELALEEPTDENPFPGRPLSLYQTLGIPELAQKLPKGCIPMGSLVGTLTETAAKHLSLPEGLPVAQGGPDAFVGMIGLGCIYPGQLCLITGSSHLHCVVSADATSAPGLWGAYKGAPLPGICFAEGGQSSTGSILRWAKNKLLGGDQTQLDYKTLDAEAAEIPPGADGLIALETFQGSRTPITDPLARGSLLGLTLSHTRGHIWRALLEAVCLGTRACIEGLASAGHTCNSIVIAGGSTRSPLWLQMHSHVTGKPVIVCENADAPLLGCAILASVVAGSHSSVQDAVKAMVREVDRIEPDQDVHRAYTNIFNNAYSKLAPTVAPLVHAIHDLRGGSIFKKDSDDNDHESLSENITNDIQQVKGGDKPRQVIVSPSLLASDWSNIRGEINRCINANTPRLHIDVFDGVFLNSPLAFTFGPNMIKAMRRCSTNIILDVHLCVHQPHRFVNSMAETGASRFIFQYEAMDSMEDAIQLMHSIVGVGMKCGISINPNTDVKCILPLLELGIIDTVNILAVEPGFGGQNFNHLILEKVRELRNWRDEKTKTHDGMRESIHHVKLLVDGGINTVTAPQVISEGADILVAGTFLFNHPQGIKKGVEDLLNNSFLEEHYDNK